jgi:hypothetical protein
MATSTTTDSGVPVIPIVVPEVKETKEEKFDKILKDSSINKEAEKMDKKELVELKSHAIKKALKIQRYVRN